MNQLEINGRQILFKARVGSHLYGTNTPESDEDFMVIFMPLPEDLLGLQKFEHQDNSTKKSNEDRRNTVDDIDVKYYSIKKFLQLLLQNNPNIVEMLFVNEENTIYIHPEIKKLFRRTNRFISQRVAKSFSGYAYSQRSKMIVKKERYKSLCRILEWIELEYDFNENTNYHNGIGSIPITQKEAIELNKRVKYYKGEKDNVEHFHKGLDLKMIYEKLKAERDRYGWRVKTDSFEKVGYDVKFGYHLIRLMVEGNELLHTGKIRFPFSETIQDLIHRIRDCQVPYETLLSMYDELNKNMERLAEETILPENPDRKWVNDWLINFHLESLR